ncbi:MAG: putative glycoside hydrolase [Thermomicrobiales bacterium]
MYRERPVVRTRMRPYVARRRRRWDAVSWWFSILFAIPIAIILGNFLIDAVSGDDGPSTMVLTITDLVSGEALAGAEVRAGDQSVSTDDKGEVRIRLPAQPMPIVVQHADYEAVYGELGVDVDRSQSLALRPSTVTGIVKDQETGAAIAGATVLVVGAGESVTTEEDGSFTLPNVPSGAKLLIAAGDYGEIEQAVDGATNVEIAMRQTSVSGRVVAANGEPVGGATVASGEVSTETAADGAFKMTGVADGANVTVTADGFVEQSVTIEGERQLALTMELDPAAEEVPDEGNQSTTARADTPEEIKAIYISAPTASTPAEMDRLIQLIDETEINAVVLDIKEGHVFYDTNVEFFRDAQAVQPLYDAEAILQQLHDHDVYVIARLVVFKDPTVAENRPDLAVMDDVTGEPWRDYAGISWVNPIYEELWDANIQLALEAAELGFDEIQYDYIRFPSDGDLSTADFGFEYTEEARVETIVDFLKKSHEALAPTGTPLAVDVFGIIAIYPDDQGIGQRLADIAPYVDYVCPMIYPSHFDPTSIDVGGEPNDLPYETVQLSLALAEEKMPGMEGKLRPWLQDFFDYDADDVRAQIQATEESNASGWMIWDAGNAYTEGAFEPEE